jgi:hypothetical protein
MVWHYCSSLGQNGSTARWGLGDDPISLRAQIEQAIFATDGRFHDVTWLQVLRALCLPLHEEAEPRAVGK